MTRTSHHPHPTPAFPVYCLDFASDTELILGGGGGASRSGIENKFKLCSVSKDGRKVQYVDEMKLSNEEDAPMTIAVDREAKRFATGINASSSSIQEGDNQNCRIFSFTDNKFSYDKGRQTIETKWSEADDYPYQKVTALSTTSLVAVGSTDDRIAILSFPGLEPLVPAFAADGELVDLHWGGEGGEWLAVTTTTTLCLYHVVAGDKPKLELKQTIYPPSLDITPVDFRAARFSPTQTSPPALHAVLNAQAPARRGPTAGSRNAPRKAFVCTFGLVAGPTNAPLTTPEKASVGKGKEKAEDEKEMGKWDVLVRREVAGKPVTVFDVSADGSLLAYGCSDLSIGILDSKTLAPLLKILLAHSFPPTALKFNPSASLLVSASMDHTIRVIVVPATFNGISPALIAILLAVLAILVALFLRR